MFTLSRGPNLVYGISVPQKVCCISNFSSPGYLDVQSVDLYGIIVLANLSNVQRSNGASSSSLVSERATDDKKVDGLGQNGKLAKIVDTTEMSKGPQDIPGHWLVTGAKLGVDKGKIVLRDKILFIELLIRGFYDCTYPFFSLY